MASAVESLITKPSAEAHGRHVAADHARKGVTLRGNYSADVFSAVFAKHDRWAKPDAKDPRAVRLLKDLTEPRLPWPADEDVLDCYQVWLEESEAEMRAEAADRGIAVADRQWDEWRVGAERDFIRGYLIETERHAALSH